MIADTGKEFYAKHLELLRWITSAASRVAYLAPRSAWELPNLYVPVQEAAKQMGVLLIPALVEPPADEDAFNRVFLLITRERADSLIVGDNPENTARRSLIISLAAQTRLPTVYPDRVYTEQGGLISYGHNLSNTWHHAGIDVGQILQGVKPGDIPFYQPSHFELVVNLKTAHALDLQIPSLILAGADEVIE